jgi:partner of Y14 and mago protein
MVAAHHHHQTIIINCHIPFFTRSSTERKEIGNLARFKPAKYSFYDLTTYSVTANPLIKTSHTTSPHPQVYNYPNDFNMPATDPVTSSGIVIDEATGQRHVPSSTRADGTKRREIRIRPGYQPPEDVQKYKNRSAEAWKNRGSGGVPGAEAVTSNTQQSGSAASNKNARRREAKKKAKAEEEVANEVKDTAETKVTPKAEEETVVDPEAEKEKKARNLKKKLRQARELSEKKDKGESLLPEQFAKVIKINELIRELDALGFDAEGEKKKADV